MRPTFAWPIIRLYGNVGATYFSVCGRHSLRVLPRVKSRGDIRLDTCPSSKPPGIRANRMLYNYNLRPTPGQRGMRVAEGCVFC